MTPAAGILPNFATTIPRLAFASKLPYLLYVDLEFNVKL